MNRPRRPDPPPMETDDRLVAAAGTAAWAVALVVLLIVGLPKADRWWLWVCAAGIGIGLFACWYVPRLKNGRAAAAERRTAKIAPGRAEPEPAEPRDAVATDEPPKAMPPA